MKPRIRPRSPASMGSNQAAPANSAGSFDSVVLSSSMAWSPPALERRSWLVEQAGDYAAPISHHLRDGTVRSSLRVEQVPTGCHWLHDSFLCTDEGPSFWEDTHAVQHASNFPRLHRCGYSIGAQHAVGCS